jgi:hypothetical protein
MSRRLDPGTDALTDGVLASPAMPPAMRRLSAQVRRKQRRLRALVADDEWQVYLQVEVASNERLAEALEAVARGAFETGRRAPKRGAR